MPVDYDDPSKGMTEIFAFWAEGEFDANLPSFIYFDGGAGGNSHGTPRFIPSFNQLHFDQRGIACSRPKSEALYKDPSFYSSVNTAKDAEAIRAYLGLPIITVYGTSYGTIPATIYGSMFSDRARAVVLEGVLFSAKATFESDMVNFELRKMYRRLPLATREVMKVYFNDVDKSYYIYVYALSLIYHDLAFKKLERTLLEIFKDKDHIDREKAGRIFSGNLDDEAGAEGHSQQQVQAEDDLGATDEVNNSMLSCKEYRTHQQKFSLFVKDETMELEFLPYVSTDAQKEDCDALNITEDAIPYSAELYPVNVPITYFQGKWDGATPPGGAIQHFKKVPRGKAQLLLARNAGHGANLYGLIYPELEEERVLHAKMLEHGLKGECISRMEIERLNEIQHEIFWSMADR